MFEIFWKLLFCGAFMSLDGAAGGDGGGSGGGDGGGSGGGNDGGEGNKAPDYKQLYEESQAKYKDVDLDVYGKAKDFDFDKAQAALEAQAERDADAAAERAAAKAKGQQQGETNKEYQQRMEKLEKTVETMTKREQDRQQAQWMEKFENLRDGAIEQALKNDYKALEELSPVERKLVNALVEKAYEQDAAQKAPKLNLKTLPDVVKGVIKEVQENRSWVAGKKIKSQNHPNVPNGQDGNFSKKPMSDGERIEAMAKFYQGSREGA